MVGFVSFCVEFVHTTTGVGGVILNQVSPHSLKPLNFQREWLSIKKKEISALDESAKNVRHRAEKEEQVMSVSNLKRTTAQELLA